MSNVSTLTTPIHRAQAGRDVIVAAILGQGKPDYGVLLERFRGLHYDEGTRVARIIVRNAGQNPEQYSEGAAKIFLEEAATRARIRQ
jgi:hypothetical protein